MDGEDALEFLQRLERQSCFAERHTESMPDVVEAGTTLEGLAVLLDRLAAKAGLRERIGEGRLLIRELAPSRRVELPGARPRELARALRMALRLVEVALSLADTRQRDEGLDVGRIDPERLAQARARGL